MILSDAIRLRLEELIKERKITAYKLSYLSGLSSSVISDCLRGKVKEPTISSIIHICEGLNIQVGDFFNSPYFIDVEALDRLDKKNIIRT